MHVAGPLAGRTVVVTRARAQAGDLSGALRALGAVVLEAPVLELADPADWGPCDAAVAALATYDWIAFTSANAVDRFLARGARVGRDVAAALAAVRVGEAAGPRTAAIGAATARRLAARGIPVALTADSSRAEGLFTALERLGAARPGRRVLLPRALEARETLPEALRAAGAAVDVVPVYRVVPAQFDTALIAAALRENRVDVVTFLSGSAACAFVDALRATGGAATAFARVRAVAIGPVTAAVVRDLGFGQVHEATGADVAAVAAAVVNACEEESPS
jgi:uroporphyrinogen III methyltransferase/synthase